MVSLPSLKVIYTGTESDCLYHASGYAQSQVAVTTLQEYYEVMAEIKSQSSGSGFGRSIVKNIARNTVTHSSDAYMKKPMSYLKRRRR